MRLISVVAFTVTTMAVLRAAFGYTEMENVNGGTVKGTVKFVRQVPKREPIEVTKDHEICGREQQDETYVVGEDNAFANVVVFIDSIEKGKKIGKRVVEINQERCRFVPHVTAFAKGTQIVLKNSDSVFHNIHARTGTRPLFNVALPLKGLKGRKRAKQAGILKFSCDAGHTWMVAWAYVTNHPYVTVTGADGAFELANVPPGEYAIKTWHEAEGERTTKVIVTSGGTTSMEIVY